MVITTRFACIWIIQTHRIIKILCYPTPFTTFSSWSPDDIIVAWIVEVIEIMVHRGNADILFPIHQFCILCKRVAMSGIKGSENVVIICCTLFKFFILKQIYILKSVVVGNDIVLIGSLADIKYSPIFTIDVDHRWAPSLPINIPILSHNSLTNCIAHIDIIAIVTSVTQNY